ncbi:flagellar brake protein [Aquabacterium sp. A7-Y]|uniref:flagellar brake protein n=1 Tax=Aquabacterium sp. A7-Y TaxID=1349605 RepID=UPI00223E7779|nr:flagellar brake protein [Aquabacterium sp. A7-Y]MCW7537041.1 flagellar brake protein [Aquabacterium sp. A7-Y]
MGPSFPPPPRAEAAFEPIADDVDIGPYRLADRADIAAALQALVAPGVAVAAHPTEGRPAVPGRLLAVDPEAGCLVFEADAAEPMADGLLLLVAVQHGVKLQFMLDTPRHAEPSRPWRLSAPLPSELIRLQRREFHRLDAPLGRPYVAEFSLNGQPYELNVYDLSLGGVGLRASPQDAPRFYIGRRLPKVKLELGDDEILVADLEIRLCRAFRSHLLGEQFHVGCRFVDLAPAAQAQLQRLVTQLEQERQVLMGSARRPPR